MTHWRYASALAAAAVLMLSACGSHGSGSGPTGAQPVSGGTLTAAIPTDPGNLDPQQTSLVIDSELAAYAYDPLVNVAANGSIVSALATSWKQSGNSATFTLSKHATCSDGSQVTPSLVARNIAYLASPKNHSPLLGSNLPVGVTARADDAAGTVVLSWPKPFPFFFEALAGVPIVCARGLADRSLLAHHTDGSGPYVLTKVVPDDQYVYTLRKSYSWGPGGATTAAKGQPAKVVMKVVSNETTAANLLLSGGVNIASASGPDRTRLAAAHLFSRSVQEYAGEMEFNETTGKPAADENVRRALTMALSLPQLARVIDSGNGAAPRGLVNPPNPCPADTVQGNVPPYDLSAAKQLLATDGWKPGPGGVRQKAGKSLALSFIYPTSGGTPTSDAAQLAVSDWTKLGVRVHAQGLSDSQISALIFGPGTWDIGWIPIQVPFPSELVQFFSGPVPAAGTNFGHVSNPAYNRLTAQAAAKPGSTGCPQWNQAEEALMRRADLIPFAVQTTPTFANHATFSFGAVGPFPTTLRLLAG